MNTIHIEALKPEQWRLYREIRLEALKTEPQAFVTKYADSVNKPDSYWQNRLANADGEKSWLLFAMDNERAVGMLGAFAMEEPTVVEIVSVYVTPAMRSLGIGQMLMNTMLHTLRQNPRLNRVILEVSEKQLPAIALYQHLGFRITRTGMINYGDGSAALEYLMEMPLNPGNEPDFQ